MKVSDQIIEVLNYLCEKIGFTIDWTADNVLPYIETLCEKLVKWEVSTSWMWIGIALFIALIFIIPAALITHNGGWEGVEWFISGLICIICLIIIGAQIYDIITCYTFPEKFIYEYVQNLLSNNNVR